MKSALTFLLLLSLSFNSFSQVSKTTDREKKILQSKLVITGFRNKIKEMDNPKDYEDFIVDFSQKLQAELNLSREEMRLFEARTEAISDFELKDLLVKHCDEIIEGESTNLLLLTLGMSPDYLGVLLPIAGIVLGIVFSPWYLVDDVLSSDI